MINVPIWVFVILVIFASAFTLVVGFALVNFATYMSFRKKEEDKEIEEKYGTRKKD